MGEATSQKSNYVGTSYYISPEQSKKENYGSEVDIYALGITFFEMNCPFYTDMERHEVNSFYSITVFVLITPTVCIIQVLTALRSDEKFPKHFKYHLIHEVIMIIHDSFQFILILSYSLGKNYTVDVDRGSKGKAISRNNFCKWNNEEATKELEQKQSYPSPTLEA